MRRARFKVDGSRWWIVSQQTATRATFLLDALEAGYVWDERIRRTHGGKGIVLPMKDGYYEHSMNCLEYLLVQFGPALPTATESARLAAKALKEAQLDPDTDDRAVLKRVSGFHSGGRGGY
jgi:hypothetical protein